MNASSPERRGRLSAQRDPETAEEFEARRQKWVEENWEAIQSTNEYVAKHGLPLAKYRQF